MTSTRTYNKICLFCRKEFLAQKRTTKYCSHKCASRAYKVRKRDESILESNFEEYVKRELHIHSQALQQIQVSLSELLRVQKIGKGKFITPNDYCEMKGISRKTLSRWIKDNKVEVKKLSSRKFLIKSDIL
jgi:hypothetical protein